MFMKNIACINWIKNYFKETGGKTAVIGISGGKDSSVVAALCKEALGKENVYGILMPNGIQPDRNDAERVVEFLGINRMVVDISTAYNTITSSVFNSTNNENFKLSEQAKINLAPRIRMCTLYMAAQSLPGGRVAGTGNLCERMLGWTTLWGDMVADFNPIGNMTRTEVVQCGDALGLPYDLTHKAPGDGLTGKTDEENWGFTYDDVEEYLARYTILYSDEKFKAVKERIDKNKWKMDMVNLPMFPNKDEDDF